MMGAFARLFGTPPLEAVTTAIEHEMPAKIAENKAAARAASDEVKKFGLIDAAFLKTAALEEAAL
jgi:Pyruvate/2-oxoacid:ferredoxin oxidoreductase gamma subunit